jgi:hypothetical protein
MNFRRRIAGLLRNFVGQPIAGRLVMKPDAIGGHADMAAFRLIRRCYPIVTSQGFRNNGSACAAGRHRAATAVGGRLRTLSRVSLFD